MGEYILSQAYGYGFAVGVGALFAILMAGITYMLEKYAHDHQDSENFTVASRSVKTGLMASAVVSSWTWPATLLTSGTWAYTYGVSGPYWYGFSGTVLILLMAVLAVEIKRICPGTHTVGEIIKGRFGNAAHIVYLCYLVGCNIIVSVMLLLGGSQGFNAATGMPIEASCFLLPLGVICYTVIGGIKATFLSDWIHTIIIYVIIITAVVQIYGTNSAIGSPGKMYDLLTEIGKLYPAPTEDGSYFSFRSQEMVMIAWSTMLGNFATVLGDPSYGQKAIASSSAGAMTGYLFGGLCWLIVPFSLGTSAGLAALALTKNPNFFTYPNMIPVAEVGKGLPVIYGMGALLGKSGAAAALTMLFMSVTSALSAELIGISSIVTYDVYRNFINPSASGKRLVTISHTIIAFWGIAMGAVSIGFNYAGVTVGWILTMLGIILDPVGVGLCMTLYFRKMSKWGIIVGMPLGTVAGILTWILSTKHFYGSTDVASLGEAKPCMIANFVSSVTPLIFAVIYFFFKPVDYDFKELNKTFLAGDDANEKEISAMMTDPQEMKKLRATSKFGIVFMISVFLLFYVMVPMAFYGTRYVFSKKFFTGWVVIIIIWLFLAFFFIAVYPIYESWREIVFVIEKALGKTPTVIYDTGETSVLSITQGSNESLNKKVREAQQTEV